MFVHTHTHVRRSCRKLLLPAQEVARVVKEYREAEFKNKNPGFEQDMRRCKECKQHGFFMHDGPTKKCRHVDHDTIVNAAALTAAKETAYDEEIRNKPIRRKCATCGCFGLMRPGASRVDYRTVIGSGEPFLLTPDVPHKDEMIPVTITEEDVVASKTCGRCALHSCLDARRIEIVPGIGGQCDACLKVSCTKCEGCKCYTRCDYVRRRCDECVDLTSKEPDKYSLTPAFPVTSNPYVECYICKTLHSKRNKEASERRKKRRKISCGYKINDFGARVAHRVRLHLRRWKATVITRGWKDQDPRKSLSLMSVRAAVEWPGDMENWRCVKESFFRSKEERVRVYDEEFCKQCMNIPVAFE